MKAASTQGAADSVMSEFIVHMLGLGICADTILGDDLRRGVSGGQKKRVTTGEVLSWRTLGNVPVHGCLAECTCQQRAIFLDMALKLWATGGTKHASSR